MNWPRENRCGSDGTNIFPRAREDADRLVRKANDLAELGEAGTPVKAGPFAVREALAEIADLMGALATSKGLTFECIVYPAVPACLAADRSLIQDMLHRLIENAIRYTPAGGVRVLASTQPASEQALALVLEVTDSGPGIPGEVLANLDSPACAQGPPGLGLRIVRKRVTDLGGKTSIWSNPEGGSAKEGTTVRLSLPVCAPVAAASFTETAIAPAAERGLGPLGLHLLIAEDCDDSLLLFRAYTEEVGHRVARAHDGIEAVEMAKRGAYDLIVMDASMPGMDGYTATRLIREWETGEGSARRPILMLSADNLERQRRMGGAVGCSGYLSKPVDREQLLRALAYYAGPDRTAVGPRAPCGGAQKLVV